MACGIYCVSDIILFVIWAVTLPIYLLLLATLVRYRNTVFQSSFFKIFISLGVADVCCMVNIYTLVKAIYWRVYNWFFLLNPLLIGTGSMVWTWQSYSAQLNGVLLLTVNRYIALVHLERYEEIFSPKNTNRFIAIQWIASLVIAAPRVVIYTGYSYQADNVTLFLDFVSFGSIGENALYFKYLTIYCFVLSFGTLLMYGRMIARVYAVSRQVAPLAQNQNSGAEVRLAGVGLVISITLFFFAFYGIFMVTTTMDLAKPWLQLLYFIVVDVFNEVNPYSLILLCTDVRVHLKIMVMGKRVQPNQQSGKRSANKGQENKAESRV